MVDIKTTIQEQIGIHERSINTDYLWVLDFLDDDEAINLYYNSIEITMAKLLYWYDMEEHFELKGVL